MSIVIREDQFPDLLPSDVKTGDRVTLLVEAMVFRVETATVDASPMGGSPAFVAGTREVEMLITEASRP